MLPDWFPARLRSRVTVEDRGYHKGHCWIVGGWSDGKGHAKMRWDGVCTFVHRVTLSLHSGTPVEDLDNVDHLCRQRACCHPEHLEDVTSKENTDRGLGVHSQFKPVSRNVTSVITGFCDGRVDETRASDTANIVRSPDAKINLSQ